MAKFLRLLIEDIGPALSKGLSGLVTSSQVGQVVMRFVNEHQVLIYGAAVVWIGSALLGLLAWPLAITYWGRGLRLARGAQPSAGVRNRMLRFAGWAAFVFGAVPLFSVLVDLFSGKGAAPENDADGQFLLFLAVFAMSGLWFLALSGMLLVARMRDLPSLATLVLATSAATFAQVLTLHAGAESPGYLFFSLLGSCAELWIAFVLWRNAVSFGDGADYARVAAVGLALSCLTLPLTLLNFYQVLTSGTTFSAGLTGIWKTVESNASSVLGAIAMLSLGRLLLWEREFRKRTDNSRDPAAGDVATGA